MTVSVADRVTHRLPRPISCNECGSPRVHLQKRGFMGLRVTQEWDLIWHCLDCLALVGCHRGTDIPLGRMANTQTREARYLAHKAFDRLWRGGGLNRQEAYAWLANALDLPLEAAHIGMLDQRQCEALIEAASKYQHHGPTARPHWKQLSRKRRRK